MVEEQILDASVLDASDIGKQNIELVKLFITNFKKYLLHTYFNQLNFGGGKERSMKIEKPERVLTHVSML